MFQIHMGKIRNIYFNDETEELLKKTNNVSALVRDLLHEHFKKQDLSQMSIEEMERLLKIEEAKQAYEKAIKEAENG